MSANLIISHILGWPRGFKRLIQVLTDMLLVSVCYVLLCKIWSISLLDEQHLYIWIGLVTVYPASLALMRVYSSIVRYIQPSIVLRLLIASILTMVVVLVLDLIVKARLPNHFLIDLMLLIAVASLLPRMLFVQLIRWQDKLDSHKVAIFGAGEAGLQLKSALETNSGYRVIAFIDDRLDLQHHLIQGLPVVSASEVADLMSKGLVEVLLAIPNASRARRKEIINLLEPMGLHIRSIPKLQDIVSGAAKVSELQDITSEDLLGRDPVPPVQALMSRNIQAKTVLVTGAGGTIGSQICREIIRLHPRKLVIFDASEFALYTIEQELLDEMRLGGGECEIIPVLGSVCNGELISRTLARHQIDTIFHAAAYKHVPMVELNPLQGIKNNTIGTWVLVNAARDAGVSAFVLVSTDKAVRPPNVMGASKRLAELCVQAIADEERDGHCKYSIVRFGNVLHSSGSVIPKFRKQIAAGGPVTVTDKAMTRYFMTVTEAAQLVIQAGAMGENGEVFVLDMGESVNIYDLAMRKIRLHGFEPKTAEHPEGDIEVKVTGIRPGEKLFEELLIKGAQATSHPRIFKSDEPLLPMNEVRELIENLSSLFAKGDVNGMYKVLKASAAIHYHPVSSDGNEHLAQVSKPPTGLQLVDVSSSEADVADNAVQVAVNK